ncbi:DUF2127 domain-containing protein [Tabrizicola flagellatus]|uniref:DUF2127 domain-containing protein n=1 Tax=Tabrizicola flagellatus TaxID=2593021 RepID=UPI0011F09EFB|nr:DUF2127 domain-containing protein [Tabrizicola flagellatus]
MLRSGRERLLHWPFEARLATKGLLTSAEALAGLGLLLTPNPLVARFDYWITHFQIAEHPTDTLASWTLRAMQSFPVPTQHFYALYLLAHGGVKLVLWRKVVWAYPAAMVVLAGYVAYQLCEFVHAGSPFLLMLAIFDLVMIGLVWQEGRALRGRAQPAA